ncbi:hypothetical protein Q7P37_009270 [Cladosporium fusiforme]
MSSTARNLFAGLPPPAECLAILIGTAEITIFGLAGLANPTSFATGFGLPISNKPSTSETSTDKPPTTPEEKAHRGLLLALAARNLEKGLTVLAFACYFRDRKAVGTCILAGLVTTTADYLAVKWYGAQEAASGHVIGMVNCSLVGGALLWWGREGAWF